MPLQHIIVCIDNSSYSVNEDIYPSRLLAQTDIMNEFYHNVLDDNYESTFGVITNGNDRPTLRCSLTREGYLISNALNHIESSGKNHFIKGLYMAEMILKHSTIDHGDKHIVCFVASPLDITLEEMTKVATQFGKSPYRVTIFSCGEISHNSALLKTFITIVNAGKAAEKQSKLTEITSYDTFEIVIRRSGLFPNDISSNNYDDDMMDPDLLAAIEASKQSYLEQTGISLDSSVITNNAIVPPTESNNSNSKTDSENAPAPAEPSNQNESTEKFYSVDLDESTVEFCREAFECPTFDPKHIPEDIYRKGEEMGLFPEQK